VKWHFKTLQGIKGLTAAEATKLAGEDPGCDRRDRHAAIEKGGFSNWRAMVQVIPEKDAETWRSVHVRVRRSEGAPPEQPIAEIVQVQLGVFVNFWCDWIAGGIRPTEENGGNDGRGTDDWWLVRN